MIFFNSDTLKDHKTTILFQRWGGRPVLGKTVAISTEHFSLNPMKMKESELVSIKIFFYRSWTATLIFLTDNTIQNKKSKSGEPTIALFFSILNRMSAIPTIKNIVDLSPIVPFALHP
jgi:hypothetical protein